MIVVGIRSGYGASLPATTAIGAATTGPSSLQNTLPYFLTLKMESCIDAAGFPIPVLIPIEVFNLLICCTCS